MNASKGMKLDLAHPTFQITFTPKTFWYIVTSHGGRVDKGDIKAKDSWAALDRLRLQYPYPHYGLCVGVYQ